MIISLLFLFFIFIHSKSSTKNFVKDITTITNSSNLVFNNSFVFENKIYEDQPKIDYKGFTYNE